MYQKNLRGLILLFALLLVVFWVAIFSATNIDAEPNITPTPNYAFWNNLPVILGGSGMPTPTPTATGPVPTVTPSVTPSPTATVSPPELPAPVLFDIDNDDQDGNYTVSWSSVNGGDYYRLEQNFNDTTWEAVYEGPALSKSRSDMPPGIYCYRVRALNEDTSSEMSNVKCVTVSDYRPPELPAPTISNIDNADQDGNYTVTWSAVSGADYYKVKQNFNDTTWDTLYEGPALSKNLSNMAPGEYCYRVRAFNATDYSVWSAVKCTIVVGEPEPEYVCEFETLYDGPRTLDSDVELLFDGGVFISHTSDNSATIFDPQDRSFREVAIPQGGGSDVAIIGDGRVLYTVNGDNPYSMLYDTVHDENTILTTNIACLEQYGYLDYSLYSIMTYCGDNHGYVYFDVTDPYTVEYPVDIEINRWTSLNTFISQAIEWIGDYKMSVSNGIVGDSVFIFAEDYHTTANQYDHRENADLPDEINNAISTDLNTIYLAGGKRRIDNAYVDTVKEAYASNPPNFQRIADMWGDRAGHAMVGLADGTLVVIGGHTGDYYYSGEVKLGDIELYIPSENKWYRAGSLNIPRESHQAIQLLNGEIFVYGGNTDPGSGHSYIGPPEIGRCEKMTNN